MLREITPHMQVYEASIHYSLIRLGHDSPLDSPAKIVDYMEGSFEDAPCQESIWVICLDRRNRPISRTRVTLGTLTGTFAHPREVFRVAILAAAASIALVHNHPSGDPSPSNADRAVTRQIRDAAEIMQIDLIDHVIIGDKSGDPIGRGYFSFRDAGLL